jgi:hypothetical protein
LILPRLILRNSSILMTKEEDQALSGLPGLDKPTQL